VNTDIPRIVTPDEVESYHRDGVVLLPRMFDRDWIELLKQGLLASRAINLVDQ